MMKRTFIALVFKIPGRLMDYIDLLKKDVKGLNVKWVETHNLHLTLAFLGDTKAEQITEVTRRLEKIIPGYAEFSIRFTRPGAFKSLSHPQVLWIGIEADEMLGKLYHDVQDLAGELGFEKDTRSYKPHLTIGRIKSSSHDNNLKELILQNGDINESSLADTIVYYESNLTPAGAVYKPINTYKLS